VQKKTPTENPVEKRKKIPSVSIWKGAHLKGGETSRILSKPLWTQKKKDHLQDFEGENPAVTPTKTGKKGGGGA